MLKKIKIYIDNLTNPLLYYIDKQGNSVFRNFCLFKNSGNLYDKIIPVKEAGKVIEQRIELSKKLKKFNIFCIIIAYLLYIHVFYSLGGLLFCELLLIILIFSARIICAEIYKKILLDTYGQYTLTEFSPALTNDKEKLYRKNYLSKILAVIILIALYCSISIGLKSLIRLSLNKSEPNYKTAEIVSNIYTLFYPQTPLIYEWRACRSYETGDFNMAVYNYIKAFKLQNNKIAENDFIKFANLLYFVKKSRGTQDAIDLFNDLSTMKKATVPQQTELLWIKSMFSIANGIDEFVESDYDDLLSSLKDNDDANNFYINGDKAYMLYLKREYNQALEIYDYLISFATQNSQFSGELPRLYAERGYTKLKLNDKYGANSDFKESNISDKERIKYEPKLTEPQFVPYKF